MKNKVISISLFIIFIIFGIFVINDYTLKLDDIIYNFIISFENKYLTYFFKSVSFIFSTPMIIFYCVLILILSKNRNKVLFISLMMIIQAIITNLIKIIYQRNRPNIYPMVVEKTYSFPSGHTMAAIVLITVIGYFYKEKYNKNKLFITFFQLIIIMLVGISRIYLGVHFFSDIVGSVLLSSSILFFIKDYVKIKSWLEMSRNK